MPGLVFYQGAGRMGSTALSAFLETLHWICAASYPLCLGYAVLSDVRRLIIPNGTCILIAAMFLPTALLAGMEASTLVWHYVTGAGLLAVGIALFSRGLIGGGDAKLLAAAGVWIGPGDLWAYLGLVAVLGGVLAAIILIAQKNRRRLPFLKAVPWLRNGEARTHPTPYGAAIGLAAVYLFYGSSVFPEAWARALG